MKRHQTLFAAALIVLAGCSGRGGSGTLVPASANPTQTTKHASVTFTMHWSAGASVSSARRRPAYVGATARSVAISVNGATPQFLNSPSTTLTISAPAGVDTFLIQTFDEQNGQGNILGQADITQTVVLDTANVLSATLNGVIASLQVTLGTPLKAGTSSTSAVNLTALDADGNTIVGPGDYNTAIKLSIQDPSSSGTLSISKTLIQTPGTPVTLSYTGGTLTSANVVASASGVTSGTLQVAPIPTIYEYPLKNAGAAPVWITPGPDGNMWFTEGLGNNIGQITPTGAITEYPVLTSGAVPFGITQGKDGNLWFTEQAASKIGRITTSGSVQEFPTVIPNEGPQLIAEFDDGTVWYAARTANISRIEYRSETNSAIQNGLATVTANAGPTDVTEGSDGNMYFTESWIGAIGESSNTGVYEFPVGGQVYAIITGPDGNLWYTDNQSSTIVQFSPVSHTIINTYKTTTPRAGPAGIIVGKDGALWFTEYSADKIGRITTSGAVTEYPMPSSNDKLLGIAAASDGSIWVTEEQAGKIARLVY